MIVWTGIGKTIVCISRLHIRYIQCKCVTVFDVLCSLSVVEDACCCSAVCKLCRLLHNLFEHFFVMRVLVCVCVMFLSHIVVIFAIFIGQAHTGVVNLWRHLIKIFNLCLQTEYN